MSITIRGGKVLKGDLQVQGSKNSALPVLAACLLTDGEVVLHNIPDISDVHHMLSTLKNFGCRVQFADNTAVIDTTNKKFTYLGSMGNHTRGVTLLMGSCLAAFKKCELYGGGGCDLGARPINYHINAFLQLGAVCEDNEIIDGNNLKPGVVSLPYPSVGATQNALFASVLLHGTTIISGAAREPEVSDLIKFLCSCGAQITGMGTSTLTVKGVKKLRACSYTVMPDRCAAITYLLAGTATGGSVTLSNVTPFMLYNILPTLCRTGIKLSLRYDSIHASGSPQMGLGLLLTDTHPGFPTDVQPMLSAVLSTCAGGTTVFERVFDSRFGYVAGINKMGADARLYTGRILYLPGQKTLHGAKVSATDLRSGAALVLAGLMAKGSTTIQNHYHIDRGYQNICAVLADMGADIKED